MGFMQAQPTLPCRPIRSTLHWLNPPELSNGSQSSSAQLACSPCNRCAIVFAPPRCRDINPLPGIVSRSGLEQCLQKLSCFYPMSKKGAWVRHATAHSAFWKITAGTGGPLGTFVLIGRRCCFSKAAQFKASYHRHCLTPVNVWQRCAYLFIGVVHLRDGWKFLRTAL